MSPFDWISVSCNQTSLDKNTDFAEHGAGQTSWPFPVQHPPQALSISFMCALSPETHLTSRNATEKQRPLMASPRIASVVQTSTGTNQEALVQRGVGVQEGILSTSTFEERGYHFLCWDQAARITLRIQRVSNILFAKFYS